MEEKVENKMQDEESDNKIWHTFSKTKVYSGQRQMMTS